MPLDVAEAHISPLLSNELQKSDKDLILGRQRISINSDRPAYLGSTQTTATVEIGLGVNQMLDPSNSYISFNFLPTTVGSTAADPGWGLTITNTAKLFQNIKLYSKTGTLIYDTQNYHAFQSAMLMTNTCAQDWLDTAGMIYGHATKIPARYNYKATTYNPFATVDENGRLLTTGVVDQVNTSGPFFNEEPANDALRHLNCKDPANTQGIQLELNLATVPILGQVMSGLPHHMFPLKLVMQLNDPRAALNYIGANTPFDLSPVGLNGTDPLPSYAPGTTKFPAAAITNPEFILSNVQFSAAVVNLSESYVKAMESRMDRNEYVLTYKNWYPGVQNIPKGTSNVSVQMRKPVADLSDIVWAIVDTNKLNNLSWDSSYFNDASNIRDYQYLVANQPVPNQPYSNIVDMYNANLESWNMLHDHSYKAQSVYQWSKNATFGQNLCSDMTSDLNGVDTRSSQTVYLNINFKDANAVQASNLYYWLSHTVVMYVYKDGTIRFAEGYEAL